ncbi:MAG TPA: PAS domain-containing sensor histidine kinase, partial [Phototrophicaceae bacterium]|nr:PAS domain-containing sensor histidine kinase [Phototrophicaceae bacterium]
ELIGQSVEMLVPTKFRDKHPGHRAYYYADTVARQMGHGMDLFALRKDGSEFPVEISLSPMETESGTLVSSAIRDITERKLAEQKLRESEARYRAVVEDQSELICRYTPDFVLTFVNDAYCRYFGKSREELIGSTFLPSIHESDQASVLNTLRSLTAENPVITSENRAYMGDGSVRWHQWRDHAIINESGKIIEYQSVGKDVTELKEMEKQRLAIAMEHEKVQILADFIAAASHDFRTPLSVINTSAYLLNRVSDVKQRNHHFKQIQEQTYHIEHLVDGLLTMSRLDRGDVFRFRALNVNSVVQQIEVRKRAQIEEKLQALKLDLDPQLPSIDADEGWLYQCLMQLVDNSIYYTPPGGMITIRTYQQADRVVISVIDTGIGISDEILPHIFKRLYRGEEHRPVGGQGLGLSIVAKIVEEHQGSIDVESKPGAGSTFRVFLPLKHVDTSVEPSLSP